MHTPHAPAAAAGPVEHPSPHTRWRAFTLIELVVVVILIAVLAAIAGVAYNQYVSNARDTAAQANLDQLTKGALINAVARDAETLDRSNFLAALDSFPGEITPGTTAAGSTWSLLRMGEVPHTDHEFAVAFDDGLGTPVTDAGGVRAVTLTSSGGGRMFVTLSTVGGIVARGTVPAGSTPEEVLEDPELIDNPTSGPTTDPTGEPTEEPTGDPTTGPTETPTEDPTPTEEPAEAPTSAPGVHAQPTACDADQSINLCLRTQAVVRPGPHVDLIWNMAPNLTGVTVKYRAAGNTKWVTAGTSTSNTFRVQNMQHGSEYEFQVTGEFSQAPTTRISNISAAVIPAVTAPVTSMYFSNTTANVSWNVPIDVTSFQFQWREAGGSWTDQSTSSALSTSGTVTGLLHGSSYEFRVVATYTSGQTAISNVATGSVAASTAPNLSGWKSGGGTSGGLNWQTSADYTNTTVRYRTEGSTAWQTLTTSSNYYSFSNLVASSRYDFQVVVHYQNGPDMVSNVVTYG